VIPQPIDQVPLFLRLSEEERELVTARLRRRATQPDETIFSAGRPSDALFIVASGWVKMDSADGKSTLANLGPGSLLGEVDTLLSRPYSLTAKSSSKTQLLSLSRLDLEDLVSTHPGIGLKFSASLGMRIEFLEPYLVHQRLRTVELLSGLTEEDLRAIAAKLDFRAFDRGDVFVEAGEPGDAVFFIEDGQVRLITQSNEGDSYEELAESAIFGHTALITGKPYPWNARAVTDVSLWILTRTAYQELIQGYPSIKLAFTRALSEPLSPTDQGKAVDKMRELPLLSDVPTEALTALVSRLVLRHFPANEVIYAEGTPGDALYIVETGEVKLLDSAFSDAQLLERVKQSETFGEMALLTGRTRAECARASTDTTIWVLYRADFDDLMVQYPEISVSLSRAISERLKSRESDFVERHLQRMSLLDGLAKSELRLIAKKVRGLRFRPNEMICYAGQPAENLFMIERGEVKRTAAGPGGEELIIDILAPGDSFGEQVIVKNGTYNATAQANEDTEIWTLRKSDFAAFMDQFPALAMTVTKLMADRLAKTHGKIPLRVAPHTSPTGRPLRPGGIGMPHISMPHVQMPQIQRPFSGAHSAPKPNPPLPPKPAQPMAPKPASTTAQTPTSSAAPKRAQSIPSRAVTSRTTQSFNTSLGQTTRATPVLHSPTITRTDGVVRRRRREPSTFFKEVGPWLSGLSIAAKLRGAALAMLMLWLGLITVPVTAFTTVSSAVMGSSISNPQSGSTAGSALAAPRGGIQLPFKIALAVSSPTPKPTATPNPTATSLPSSVPTRRPVVQPTTVALAPAPAPAAPLAPPLPPIDWDSRLGVDSATYPDLGGIRIIPATVAHGQKFWRAVRVRFEGLGESGNDHTIYVKTMGEDGKRVDTKRVRLTSAGGLNELMDAKNPDDVCDCSASYPMFGDGYNANVEDDIPSDKVFGMCMCGIPNVYSHKAHVNYKIVFQLVTNP
jgi:CRP-like cAMP-binding protein